MNRREFVHVTLGGAAAALATAPIQARQATVHVDLRFLGLAAFYPHDNVCDVSLLESDGHLPEADARDSGDGRLLRGSRVRSRVLPSCAILTARQEAP